MYLTVTTSSRISMNRIAWICICILFYSDKEKCVLQLCMSLALLNIKDRRCRRYETFPLRANQHLSASNGIYSHQPKTFCLSSRCTKGSACLASFKPFRLRSSSFPPIFLGRGGHMVMMVTILARSSHYRLCGVQGQTMVRCLSFFLENARAGCHCF